jgi:hypothetical protein
MKKAFMYQVGSGEKFGVSDQTNALLESAYFNL